MEDVWGNHTSSNNSHCRYDKMPYLMEKFWLVSVFGTVVATVGLFANVVMFIVFLRPSLRHTHVLYLAGLACLDIWLLVTYIIIFPIQILYDVTEDLELYQFWCSCIREMYCLSKIVQMASTYVIVVATLERYCLVVKSGRFHQISQNFTSKRRVILVLSVVTLSCFLKCSSYWEISIHYLPECSGFQSMSVTMGTLAKNPVYQVVVMFYLTHLTQLFLPFILLLFLNLSIIASLRRSVSSPNRISVSSRSSSAAFFTMRYGSRRISYVNRLLSRNRPAGKQPFKCRASYAAKEIPSVPLDNPLKRNCASMTAAHYGAMNGECSQPSPQVHCKPKISMNLTLGDANIDQRMGIRKQSEDSSSITGGSSARKTVSRSTIRNATKMLVAIVSSYLISSSLSILIAFLEHVNKGFLGRHPRFYTFSVDMINILSVLCASTRVLIYYACNQIVRDEVRWLLCPRRELVQMSLVSHMGNFANFVLVTNRRTSTSFANRRKRKESTRSSRSTSIRNNNNQLETGIAESLI